MGGVLSAFDVLKPRSRAEVRLLECAKEGKWCRLGEECPAGPEPGKKIRAEFLRALLLEGRCHYSGVHLEGAYIDGAINLDGASKVAKLHILKCTLSGNLSFCDAETSTIKVEASYIKAINGYGAKVDGDLLLWGSEIKQGVHLFGAEITSTFSCSRATAGKRLDSRYKDGFSLNLDTASICGNLDLSNIKAKAVVRLGDAHIGGTLDCSGGRFEAARSGSAKVSSTQADSPKPWEVPVRAIRAYRLKLAGSLYLRNARSAGELAFTGAEIDGDADCRGGYFWAGSKNDPIALRFSRSKIGGNTYLRNVCVMGKVEFAGATVQGVIDCVGGRFFVPKNAEASDLGAPGEKFAIDALSLTNTQIKGGLLLAGDKGSNCALLDGSLDLKGAFVRVLVDCVHSWPKQYNGSRSGNQKRLPNVIHLDSFTFERFGGEAPKDAKKRMEWLKLQPRNHMEEDFRPQPFEQLIKVLKNMGHPEDVRELAIERERRLFKIRRKRGGLFSRLHAYFLTATVGWLMGYGYRPFRAIVFMLVTGVFCGAFYDCVKDQAFVPRDSPDLGVRRGARLCASGTAKKELGHQARTNSGTRNRTQTEDLA